MSTVLTQSANLHPTTGEPSWYIDHQGHTVHNWIEASWTFSEPELALTPQLKAENLEWLQVLEFDLRSIPIDGKQE